MINSFKNLIQENSDTLIDESVEREIKTCKATEYFIELWNDITNQSIHNILDHLKNNFEVKNPILKEEKLKKKYPLLNQARKLRYSLESKKVSNNGSVRVINTYISELKGIYLLICYKKNAQDDITKGQAAIISYLIQELKKGNENV